MVCRAGGAPSVIRIMTDPETDVPPQAPPASTGMCAPITSRNAAP